MRSLPRPALFAAAAAGLLAAAPAHAAGTQGVLTEVQAYLARIGRAISGHVHALAAGDMATIQLTTFALSGFIGLIGLWLLLVSPRIRPDEAEDEVIEIVQVETAPAEGETDRPTRLLEAIAAAKAQMSISQAEKKHSR